MGKGHLRAVEHQHPLRLKGGCAVSGRRSGRCLVPRGLREPARAGEHALRRVRAVQEVRHLRGAAPVLRMHGLVHHLPCQGSHLRV